MKRIKVDEDEPIEVPFTARERTLILDHTFGDPQPTDRLRTAPVRQAKLLTQFTLYGIEELCGYVAADANHTKDRRLARELQRLFERLPTLMERYDDGNWQGNVGTSGSGDGLAELSGCRRRVRYLAKTEPRSA
jgi:hypothetical protein